MRCGETWRVWVWPSCVSTPAHHDSRWKDRGTSVLSGFNALPVFWSAERFRAAWIAAYRISHATCAVCGPGYRRISRCLSTRLLTRDRQAPWPNCPAQFWDCRHLVTVSKKWKVRSLSSRSPKSLQSLTGLRSSLRHPLCLTKAGSCGGHHRADARRPEL